MVVMDTQGDNGMPLRMRARKATNQGFGLNAPCAR